jgi:hypothetical protein
VHLVFLNQYYPPDAAPTGVLLADLVEHLLQDGHEVTIMCAAGGYAKAQTAEKINANIEHPTPNIKRRTEEDCGEELKHSAQASTTAIDDPQSSSQLPRIIRIRATQFGRKTVIGKLLDYASYYLGVVWKLLTLRPRPERIVAMTTPPYLSIIARSVSKLRAADHAHWVMDLYPDVMAAHGMITERSVLYRMLAGLTRWGFGGKRCAAVLTLGPDMAERVERHVKKNANIEHSTSNIEYRKEKLTVLGDSTGPFATSRQGTAVFRVSWVPLWGAERKDGNGFQSPDGEITEDKKNANITQSTSNTGCRTQDDCGAELQHSAHAIRTSGHALALRRQRGWKDDELIVMYSGNMGLGHRFGEILEAAADLQANRLRINENDEKSLFFHSKLKIQHSKSSSSAL